MLNHIPDLPKDFAHADKILQYGGTTMGIFKLNGGKLEVAYAYRRWQEDGIPLYQVYGPLAVGDSKLAISNVLEGMLALVKQKMTPGQKIYALLAGRASIFRLFTEDKIIGNSLVHFANGRFQGQVLIGNETYLLYAEENKYISPSRRQIAFIDEDLKIIGQ